MIFFVKKLTDNIFKHSKLTENKVVLEELENRNWQYLVENLISSIENKKTIT